MDTHTSNLTGRRDIELALTRVGELLAAEGEAYALVILGGAALNLLGIVSRTTTDVDILAFGLSDTDGARRIAQPPTPLPAPLARAIRLVADDMHLAPDWMNTGPALQWLTGLPPGLPRRLVWRSFGGALDVGLVSRYDLVFFKLFAATDSEGTSSVHYRDLLALAPTMEELTGAATWVRGQDVSPEFSDILDLVVTHASRDIDLR